MSIAYFDRMSSSSYGNGVGAPFRYGIYNVVVRDCPRFQALVPFFFFLFTSLVAATHTRNPFVLFSSSLSLFENGVKEKLGTAVGEV